MILNRKQNMVVLLGLALGAFLLTATAGYANEGQAPEGKEPRKEWKAKRTAMFEQLGLTEEQKQALKTHKESHRDEMKVLREQIREKRQAFRKTLEDPQADENAIKTADGEVKALKDQLNVMHLNGILEVRKILTPEQFKKFNELKKDRMLKHRNGKKGSPEYKEK